MSNENEAPFSFSDIEDVRIIVKAKGKNYAITPKKEISKEDAKSTRIALVSVLLEDHDIVVPSLEEINPNQNE